MSELPDQGLSQAKRELEMAYQFFNWTTEPRLIDEAIHRIRAAELRLDNLLHGPLPNAGSIPLPWIDRN